MKKQPPLDDLAIADLAVRAQVDPRSIRKALRGERVRGLAGARIARVLEERERRATLDASA
jgi:hypothetical protein